MFNSNFVRYSTSNNVVTLKTGLRSLEISIKVKVKVRTLDIAPLRETPPQKRSGTDHTVLPANFTAPIERI